MEAAKRRSLERTTTCRSEATRRKRKGIQKVGKTAAPWVTRVNAAIERIEQGTKFTAEDLRKKVRGQPPHANAWGTVLHNAAVAGLIVRHGYQPGERPESHARILAIWCRV